MNDFISSAQSWWIGSAVGGGIVLLLASLLARRANGPAAVQRLGEWGMAAALMVAVLRFGPTWLNIPVSRQVAAKAPIPCNCTPQFKATVPAPVDLVMAPTPISTDVLRDVPANYHQPIESSEPPTVATMPHARELPPCPEAAVSLADSLILAYIGIVGVLVMRWLAGQWALARIIQRGRHAPEPMQQIFDRVAMQTGQTETRLIVSDRVPVPMCCGMRTPTVVIPRSLVLRNDPKVWRWIFAHELTHLARRDTWSSWFMGLTQCVYFYLPWFYWLRRQIRLSQEYMADAYAAAQGSWADDYAQFLVSLAHCPAAPQGATGVLGKTSDLYRRVTMVLQPKTGGSNSRRQLVSGIACLMFSAVVLAGLGVRATAAEDDKAKGDGADKKHEIIVEVITDDAKKDGDKADEKKIEKKRVAVLAGQALGGMGGINKGEIEKKLRVALEKAKLGQDEIDKIVKEVTKGLDQANMAITFAPMAGQHIGDLAAKQMDLFKSGEHTFALAAGDGNFTWTTPQQGRLGISADKPSNALVDQLGLTKDSGLVVTDVKKKSAAEKAGLKSNDIILSFAGKDVPSDVTKFIELLDGVSSDKEVECMVLRKGKKETVSGIKLAEKVDRAKVSAEAVEKLTEAKAKMAEAHLAMDKAKTEMSIKLKDVKAVSNKSDKSTNKSVSVSINDGEFKATEKDGDSTLVVTGTVENKKVNVTNVSIDEPGLSAKYSSLDNVPAKYKARVEKLISNSGDSPVRFEFRKD